MRVLVVDVGGSNVKILASGQDEPRRFESDPQLSARAMVAGVKKLARGWDYDVVAIGYPGAAKDNQPVKVINDAAMQALGSYDGGKLLFLGLGTGLGTTMVVDGGLLLPMELAHLPYRGKTFEDHVGEQALERLGKKKWRKRVEDVIERLRAALLPDDIVIGGGNVRHLDPLPDGCRAGDNANAFTGGFRLWQGAPGAGRAVPRKRAPVAAKSRKPR
jgi:polyphosphate glucokinase